MNIKIIPLEEKYLEETISLLNRVFPIQDEEENADVAFRSSLNPEKYEETLEKWGITRPDYFLLIDLEKDVVVGTSGLYEMLGDTSSTWLGWTSVDFPYRRNGLGRTIVNFCLDEAKRRGYKMMKLHTVDIDYQRNAHKLYESLGFKLIRRGPEKEIGHDRLYYEKVLI